jgi:hypothetical protein
MVSEFMSFYRKAPIVEEDGLCLLRYEITLKSLLYM